MAYPTGQAFGIVGVDGGVANDANRCFRSELSWALASPGLRSPPQPAASLYINTGDPGPIPGVSDWRDQDGPPTMAAARAGGPRRARSWVENGACTASPASRHRTGLAVQVRANRRATHAPRPASPAPGRAWLSTAQAATTPTYAAPSRPPGRRGSRQTALPPRRARPSAGHSGACVDRAALTGRRNQSDSRPLAVLLARVDGPPAVLAQPRRAIASLSHSRTDLDRAIPRHLFGGRFTESCTNAVTSSRSRRYATNSPATRQRPSGLRR